MQNNDLTTQAVEYRVVGPPGCGKTTYLSEEVTRHVHGGARVMILSLTKAAAAEIGGRGLPISFDALGTLHSHCYHALGTPVIAEDREHLELWNEQHPNYPISLGANDLGERIDGDNLEPTRGPFLGDECMMAHQICRARMMGRDDMPNRILEFADLWNGFKRRNGLMDFTDLIETCLEDVHSAPGFPDVMFVDEAQDMDLLEMSLVRKWGDQAGTIYIVGDPDQAIYTWRGADPGAFTAREIPEEHRQVLAQSYRVPAAVHAHAVRWIEEIAGRERIEYRPRDHEGEVRSVRADWKNPEQAVEQAGEHLAEGKTVMFLTTCSYMLQHLIAALRDGGIPFHNPYRRRNGAWNPLQRRRGQTATADRIAAYLKIQETAAWTAQDINNWTDLLRIKGVLNPDGRKMVRALTDAEDGYAGWSDIYRVLTEEAVDAGMRGDLEWLSGKLTAAKRATAQYPIAIARNRGVEELVEIPRLVVGTVHSVKGAEADVVYLFPDISRSGMAEWTGSADRQASVYRLFYVGMTRARESLIICNPADECAVNLHPPPE